jgi:pSer/pThr/pTyr-binding forkhead associated (FHA) protein
MPVPIEERTVLIGRRTHQRHPLIEESVSTAHAVIFEMNGKRYIRDLNSRTGTFVNDQKVEQIELKFGDEIRIGETHIGYASASGVKWPSARWTSWITSSAPTRWARPRWRRRTPPGA